MNLKFPFYAKITICLVSVFALFTILYITKFIVVPLVFAIVISIVLSPIVDFFVKHKVNRNIAIVLAIFLAFLLIAGLGILIISQVSQLSDSWPALVDKFTAILNQSISSISGYFDVNPSHIHEWIAKTKNQLISTSGLAVGQTIVSVGSSIAVFFLIPVYVFLLIFYQSIILEFIRRVSGKNNQAQVGDVVTQTKTVIQQYLIGLLIETAIVAILDITALFMLGIEYAILIGVIGALLNLIPYIGGIVAVALPMAIALATKTPMYSLYVLAAYYLIQFIDNNYIVPKIVASKVKINALFSIIVVLAGNALWGISGMFLSIPLIAIVKLIFDNIESMKPWGFLLGDTMPPLIKKPVFRKKKIIIS
jgi:predicted PurR-regulated permease PerM